MATGSSLVSKLREALSEAQTRERRGRPTTDVTPAQSGIGRPDRSKAASRPPLAVTQGVVETRKGDVSSASGSRVALFPEIADRIRHSLSVKANLQAAGRDVGIPADVATPQAPNNCSADGGERERGGGTDFVAASGRVVADRQEGNEMEGEEKKGGRKGKGKGTAASSGRHIPPIVDASELKEVRPSRWWRRMQAEEEMKVNHMSATHRSYLSARLKAIITQLESGELAGEVDSDALTRLLALQESLVERNCRMFLSLPYNLLPSLVHSCYFSIL